jgi:hypothetical protein
MNLETELFPSKLNTQKIKSYSKIHPSLIKSRLINEKHEKNVGFDQIQARTLTSSPTTKI